MKPFRTIELVCRLRVLPVLLFCITLVACSSKPAQFTQESFSIDSPYKSRLDSNSVIACESARRVLLGDGYIIDIYNNENIKGRRAYRSDSDRSTFIEMNVVCVDEPDGSMVYANGLLSTYDVKRSGGSASVGVSALGSVSLPFGQSADSMVKISDETIRDREFYRRFFNALNVVMARVKKASERAAQQAGSVFTRQQKQLGFSEDGDAQVTRPTPDPDGPAVAEALPPMQRVEPARTAEALDEAHIKKPQSPEPEMIPLSPARESLPPIESAEPDPGQAESTEADAKATESAEPATRPVKPVQPDPTAAESVEPGTGPVEPVQPDPTAAESVEPDPGQAESTGAEPTAAESSEPGSEPAKSTVQPTPAALESITEPEAKPAASSEPAAADDATAGGDQPAVIKPAE